MIPHISKEINSNFNVQYKCRTTSQRRSNRNRTTHEVDNQPIVTENDNEAVTTRTGLDETTSFQYCNNLILCNFLRCYVEDFMLLNVGKTLLVLVPANYGIMITSKWTQLFNSDIRSTQVQFSKYKYSCYTGVVFTNPFINNISSGMHLSDYASGFGTHNYGCSIMFSS